MVDVERERLSGGECDVVDACEGEPIEVVEVVGEEVVGGVGAEEEYF